MVRLLRSLELLFSFATVQLSLNCLVMASDFTTFGLDYMACGLLALFCFGSMLVSRLLLVRAKSASSERVPATPTLISAVAASLIAAG